MAAFDVANHKALMILIKRIGPEAFLGRGKTSRVGSDP
jgi:hypothetical protein